uniref:Uncharacterized protein n=1 Tax=Arundo donax TaxID=35708 RepID=A0A0A8YMN1_ARUDO
MCFINPETAFPFQTIMKTVPKGTSLSEAEAKYCKLNHYATNVMGV